MASALQISQKDLQVLNVLGRGASSVVIFLCTMPCQNLLTAVLES